MISLSPRIVVAGGHSAGRIEPAMNLADAVRRLNPSAKITALGTVRGSDTTLIPARGYPLELIPPAPLPRAVNRALARTPGLLRDAVRAAGEVMDRTRAEVVVSFGGYAAAPAVLAARRRRIPIVVHESNVRPGVANRLAARMTTRVFTAPAGVRLTNATSIGIPLRRSIAGLDRAALAPRPAGNSACAPRDRCCWSPAVRKERARSTRRSPVLPRHCGPPTRRCCTSAGRATAPESDPPYVVLPYVDEMRCAYAAADFAVCRSGAMTCAELAAVGLPAVYVPLPERGGEQRLNAEPAVAAVAAPLVDDAEFSPAWIEKSLLPVLAAPDRIAAMSSG